MGFDAATIARDIPKRPFALVGFLALLLLVPLAATSFNRAIKALGAARWQALHQRVYAIVLLGLLHFFWMRAAKNNFAEVAVYAAVIALLLGWRLRGACARCAPLRLARGSARRAVRRRRRAWPAPQSLSRRVAHAERLAPGLRQPPAFEQHGQRGGVELLQRRGVDDDARRLARPAAPAPAGAACRATRAA